MKDHRHPLIPALALAAACALPCAALAATPPATATTDACAEGEAEVFYCPTTNGRHVRLCDAGHTLRYAYGRPGMRPELSLSVPRQLARTSQWEGIGRWISYAVRIPNGEFSYMLFWGADRISDDHPIEAGIHVERGDALLSTILCRPDTARQALEGIDLPPLD